MNSFNYVSYTGDGSNLLNVSHPTPMIVSLLIVVKKAIVLRGIIAFSISVHNCVAKNVELLFF